MLQHLRIENYALIRSLDVDFSSGFCVITGETGAGKSILLGALGLVLGQRADSGILFDEGKKCVIEAHFDVGDRDLRSFFLDNDLDEETDGSLLLRREVLPGGKSRAFVNDTPVTLPVLKELASFLVDIHSQHETLTLGDSGFQLRLLDSYLVQKALPLQYARCYESYARLRRQLESERESRDKSRQEQDYWQFLYQELEQLHLQEGEQPLMEQALERLAHAEQLQTTLLSAVAELHGEEFSIRTRLDNLVRSLKKIAPYHTGVSESLARWDSILVELADLEEDLIRWSEGEETDPGLKTRYEERLDILYRLERKHHVQDADELIALQKELSDKLGQRVDADEHIRELEEALSVREAELNGLAESLRRQRKISAEKLESAIVKALSGLGMAQSRLKISFSDAASFTPTGKDRVAFLFSANLGSEPKEIGKVASGGELSRLMLAVKSVIHQKNLLGSIIFDEIDTGVSGNIAGKVAAMMQEMSRYMQVIAISHLPQIAAAAQAHFFVYKSVEDGRSISNMRRLTPEEHVRAIASMLSNENITEAALKAAEELIKG